MEFADRLQPLPIRVHPFGGETVDSYARRLSAANFDTTQDIEKALREVDLLKTARRDHPDRIQLWRVLGATHPTVFSTPRVINGDWVTDRPLCRKCTRGQVGRGRLPHVGHVCLRHRRWITGTQIDVSAYKPVVLAEAAFRRRLPARGVMFDSPVMREALLCAQDSCTLTHATGTTEVPALTTDILLYPAQVRFARLLCSPAFLRTVVNPTGQARQLRDQLINDTVTLIATTGMPTQLEPALQRLRQVAFILERAVAAGRAAPPLPYGDRWNLLRFTPP